MKDGRIYLLPSGRRVLALWNGSRWLLYDERSLPAVGDPHDYEVDARGVILCGGNQTGWTVDALVFTGWTRFDAA
jgi:hypothetical protein